MQEAPYLVKKPDYDNRTGNDRYSGFCVDLMEKIAVAAGFNYTFVLVHDRQYGVPLDKDTDGQQRWNGMIGELLNKVKICIETLRNG